MEENSIWDYSEQMPLYLQRGAWRGLTKYRVWNIQILGYLVFPHDGTGKKQIKTAATTLHWEQSFVVERA